MSVSDIVMLRSRLVEAAASKIDGEDAYMVLYPGGTAMKMSREAMVERFDIVRESPHDPVRANGDRQHKQHKCA